MGETNKSKLKTETDSSNYDKDAGIVDIVEYVAQGADKLTDKMRGFQTRTDQLTAETNLLTDRLIFLQKQPNANGRIRLACQQYSEKLNEYADYTLSFSQSFKSEWNLIYLYLKDALLISDVKNEDKRIIAEELTALQYNFEKFYNAINGLSSKFASIPKVQKDLTAAVKHYITISVELSESIKLAMDNCEEIIFSA